MRSRRTAPVFLLVVAASCISYLAIGARVRGTSQKRLAQAALLLQQKEPAKARNTLRWMLWFEPDHPAALHLTALSYLQEQNLPAAISHLERIDNRSPVDRAARLDLAAALLADRQFQRAEMVLSDYLVRYADSLLARRQLSGLFLTERRQREARQVLENFLGVPANDALSSSDLLLALRDLSTAEFHPPLPETCRPVLEEALERNPDQTAVRVGLARCYLELGNADQAERMLQDAFTRRPDDPGIRLIYCGILLEQGRLDDAESVLLGEAAGASTPADKAQFLEQDDRFWELRGRIAEARTDYELALTYMARAIAIRPSDPEYESRRARLLQRVGRAEEARQAYVHSHELARSELDLWDLSRELGARDPTTAECLHVARLYESLGKPRPAAAWRRLAVQMEAETSPRIPSFD